MVEGAFFAKIREKIFPAPKTPRNSLSTKNQKCPKILFPQKAQSNIPENLYQKSRLEKAAQTPRLCDRKTARARCTLAVFRLAVFV